ncbi:hypothetical protein ACVWYN_001023 [Pedobacter sp. UYP24]
MALLLDSLGAATVLLRYTDHTSSQKGTTFSGDVWSEYGSCMVLV